MAGLDHIISSKRINNKLILSAIALLFFVNSFFHKDLYYLNEAQVLAKEYQYIVSMKGKPDKKVPIITMHAPCIISTLKRKAVELKTFFEIHKNGHYPEKIILYLGHWIHFQPGNSEDITSALSKVYKIEDIYRSGEYAFLVLKLRKKL